MKKLFSILLILISVNCFAQSNYKWKRLGYYTASIAFDATGDALNNTGNKELGHLFDAASVGVLFVVPFDKDMRLHFSDARFKDFAIDAIIYTGLRYAIFNLVYNLVSGQSWDYIGNTDYVDKMIQNSMYSTWTKTITITFVIALNFNE